MLGQNRETGLETDAWAIRRRVEALDSRERLQDGGDGFDPGQCARLATSERREPERG